MIMNDDLEEQILTRDICSNFAIVLPCSALRDFSVKYEM